MIVENYSILSGWRSRFHVVLFASWFALALLRQSFGQQAIMIDDFSAVPGKILIVTGNPPLPKAFGLTIRDGMIGGETDFIVELINASIQGRIIVAVGNGSLLYDQDATSTGRAFFYWDGQDNDPDSLRATGLSGIDLTSAGTQNACQICVLENDNPVNVSLIFFSSHTQSSELIQSLPGLVRDRECIIYPYDEFTATGADGGADITNIGAIGMVIGAGDSVTGTLNLKIDEIRTTTVITSVKSNPESLTKFVLHANYPNPFNPSTVISYSIPNSGDVSLNVYDILGREIQTLVSEFQNAGTYFVNFDASKLSSGIYFYNLQVGNDFVETKKMLLMR